MTRCLRPIPYLKRKHPNGFRLENVLQYAAITCLIMLPASAARSSRAVNPSDGSTVEKPLRENNMLEVVPLCWATAEVFHYCQPVWILLDTSATSKSSNPCVYIYIAREILQLAGGAPFAPRITIQLRSSMDVLAAILQPATPIALDPGLLLRRVYHGLSWEPGPSTGRFGMLRVHIWHVDGRFGMSTGRVPIVMVHRHLLSKYSKTSWPWHPKREFTAGNRSKSGILLHPLNSQLINTIITNYS